MQVFDKGQGLAHRHRGEILNGQPAHGDAQGFPAQALAAALRAGHVGHVLLEGVLHRVGAGLAVAALQVGDHALEGHVEGAGAVGTLVGHANLLALRAVEQHVHRLVGELGDGRVQREVVGLGETAKVAGRHGVGFGGVPAGNLDRALVEGLAAVGDHDVRIHLQQHAQARAAGARAVGVVEGEQPGLQRLDGDAAVRAGVVLGVEGLLIGFQLDDAHQPAAQVQRGLQRVAEALLQVGADDDAVHHDLDGVLLRLGQGWGLSQLAQLAVDARAHKALLLHVLQKLRVLALAAPHHRGEQHDLRALGQGGDGVDDLIHGLALNLPPALGAVGHADARVHQAQVIVDLGDGAHGGARVAAGGLLVDGDGRGQALNHVHLRLVHLAQKLPGIAGQGFHISALALGVDGVEGKGRLSRAGKAGHDDQLVAGKVDVDALQVVRPRAADADEIICQFRGSSCGDAAS